MEATLNTPPNTQAFNPENCGVSLAAPGTRPIQPAIPSTPAPPPMSELCHLSTLVTAIFSAVNPALVTPSCTPAIPAVPKQIEDQQAPLIPSPSDIPRFLKHASTVLGVCHTLKFELPLCHKGYGPDILPDVDDSALMALGISAGDILRLKNGSQKWWNGPDAKRKFDEDVDNSFFSNKSQDVSDDHIDKHCHYEYLFPDGGGTQYNGPPMKEGDWGAYDDSTTYWDEGWQKMVPIPAGYTAPPYGAHDDDEDELGVFHG
jgi:hypothetical protein